MPCHARSIVQNSAWDEPTTIAYLSCGWYRMESTYQRDGGNVQATEIGAELVSNRGLIGLAAALDRPQQPRFSKYINRNGGENGKEEPERLQGCTYY